jgi:hypothetical protein
MAFTQEYQTTQTQTAVDNITKSKASTGLYKFPQNIGGPDGSHFVLFQIKVPKATKVAQNIGGGTDTAIPGATGTSSLGTAINRATGTTGYQYGYTENYISDTVALYMPNSGFKTEYRADWQQFEFGQFMTTMNNAIDAYAGNLSLQDYQSIGRRIFQESGNSVLSALGIPLREYLQKQGNYVLNPQVEMLFKGVPHRQHNFTFIFYASSIKDTTTIDNIVKIFKYHQAPEFAETGNGYFIYPSVFDIKFYSDGTLNKFLPRTSTSALTSCTVHYNPIAEWQTFENNAPVMVELSLSFTELEIITKTKIAQGY